MTSRAADYDAWYETLLGATAHRIELALVEAVAQPKAGETALDVGCGTGIYSAWLAEHGLDVVGVDHAGEMLAAAAAKTRSARFVPGEATALPFGAGKFDLVLAVTLFCFLDAGERRVAAHELLRVAKPGGRVVIAELAPYSSWALKRRIKSWRSSGTWRRAHFSTARELTGLLREAGATGAEARYGLYVPASALAFFVRHANAIERAARRLGPIGAGFVVACGKNVVVGDRAKSAGVKRVARHAAPGRSWRI